ncbi:MAG: hypothetical protein ACRDJN_11910 [Chloroflexota bacterium]
MGWDESDGWNPRDSAGSAFVLLAAGLSWAVLSVATAAVSVFSLAARPRGRAWPEVSDEI